MTFKSFSHNFKISLHVSYACIEKSHILLSLFSLTSLSAPLKSLNGSSVNIPMVGYFVCNPIYISFKCHFQCYHFLFLLHFHLCWFSLLTIHIFKFSDWFINERQRSNTTTCFAIRALRE